MLKPVMLITRPSAEQAVEMQVAAAAGWQVLAFSPLELEPHEQALANLNQQVQEADVVFWVSPGAVKLAAPQLDFTNSRAIQMAVGKATAQALSNFYTGQVIYPVDGNDSEAVLRLDIWQALPVGARVLIIRGHGGRKLLAETLAQKGFQVSFAEVYKRVLQNLDWTLIDQPLVSAAYVTSSEIGIALFESAPAELTQKLETLLYLTHHQRIAQTLQARGARNIRVIQHFDVQTLQEAFMDQQQPPHNNQPPSDSLPPIVVTPEGVAQPAQVKPSDQKPQTTVEAQSQSTQQSAQEPNNSTKFEQKSEPVQPTLKSGKHMAEQNTPLQAAAPVVIKQSSGRGLATGALVLALLGLGASGFLFVQGQNVLKTQELEFAQRIDKAAVGESQNAGMLQDTLRKQTDIDTRLAQLNNTQQQNTAQIAAGNRAYQELLKGRAAWLVDETEATLNLASQQLLLSGNVPVAVSVLENIEKRLSRFDKPELLPIKQALSSDLAELKQRPYLDISGASLRVDRLETAVSSLPLLVDNTLKPGAPVAEAVVATGSWWQDTWQKTLNSLKGLVEVRRLNNNDAMLVAPEQAYFVRENLRLRLLDARLAMMQRNGDVYQSDLNNIEAAVKTYFDPKSPATQSWLKELAELKALDISTMADNALKASLAAVGNYQENYRTGQAIELPADASSQVSQPASSAASEASSPVLPNLPNSNVVQPVAPASPAVVPVQPTKPSEKAPETKAPVKGEQA